MITKGRLQAVNFTIEEVVRACQYIIIGTILEVVERSSSAGSAARIGGRHVLARVRAIVCDEGVICIVEEEIIQFRDARMIVEALQGSCDILLAELQVQPSIDIRHNIELC